MGGFGITHWIIFGVIAILVLGGGRFSSMMGDVAKGIKQFKKGMAEDDEVVPPTRIEAQRAGDPVIEPAADRVRDAER